MLYLRMCRVAGVRLVVVAEVAVRMRMFAYRGVHAAVANVLGRSDRQHLPIQHQ